jgi:hypothetical protein
MEFEPGPDPGPKGLAAERKQRIEAKEAAKREQMIKQDTYKYLDYIKQIQLGLSQWQMDPRLKEFISNIKAGKLFLDYQTVFDFMNEFDSHAGEKQFFLVSDGRPVTGRQIFTECIDTGCDDSHETIRYALGELGWIAIPRAMVASEEEEINDFQILVDQNENMNLYISAYLSSMRLPENLLHFLTIINRYRYIVDLETKDDNFNDIFHLINEFFRLNPKLSNENVIFLSDFLEPVRFYSFLFPYGNFCEELGLDKKFYDYCNNIITRIINCYLEVGNITEINATELNTDLIKPIQDKPIQQKESETQINNLSELLETNIAEVVKSFINDPVGSSEENDEENLGGGMVGGGFNEKITSMHPDMKLEEEFSDIDKFDELLKHFEDDVQMTYYILSLYVENGNDISKLSEDWYDFYYTYNSLNYFFPKIFDHYSDLKKFGSNDDKLDGFFSYINQGLMGNMEVFDRMTLENIYKNDYSSDENIGVLVDTFERVVTQLEKKYTVVKVGSKVGRKVGIGEGNKTGFKPKDISGTFTPPGGINLGPLVNLDESRKPVKRKNTDIVEDIFVKSDPLRTPTTRDPNTNKLYSLVEKPFLFGQQQKQDVSVTKTLFKNMEYDTQRADKRNRGLGFARQNSLPTNYKFSAGGQKGGDCRNITFDAFVVLFAYKIITEYVHDIGTGDRGAAVKNTDIYDRVLGVFMGIAQLFKNGMGQTILTTHDEPSATWLNELDNEISHIDEDKYMSTIIRAIVTHCPDIVNEFYYKPMYLYVCKYDEKKMTKSQYQVMYNLFRDKIADFFPKEKWMIFIKPEDTKEDIHLYVFKKNIVGAFLSNRNLGIHTQDMGLEDIPLGIALKMEAFNDIYNEFFGNDDKNNDIDEFFDDDAIKQDYIARIRSALAPLESGNIDSDGDIINDTMQLFTPPKGLDPLNTHKFQNGLIMDGSPDPKKLYVGYPPGEYAGFLAAHSAAHPLSQATQTYLTKLNEATYNGTIDTMNKLLSYWIGYTDPATGDPLFPTNSQGVPQIVSAYTFTKDQSNVNVNGVRFTGPLGFVFELHFEETTVAEVCDAMVKFNSGNVSINLIQQMNNIYRHPGFRFKKTPGSQEEKNMKLAILASFKSYGDESQRLISKYLSDAGYKLFFLTKDRVLLVETIKFNHPILAITKSPDESFNPKEPNVPGGPGGPDDPVDPDEQDEPDVSIRGISCINSGILSNRKSEIDKIKNTFELLEEAINNYSTNIANLQKKIDPPGSQLPQPPVCYTNANTLLAQLTAAGINKDNYDAAAQVFFDADNSFIKAKDTAAAAGSDDAAAEAAAKSAADQVINQAIAEGKITSDTQITKDSDNKGRLNELVRYNGIIKQLLISLQYVDQSIEPDDITKLINTQIKKAVSVAISDKSMLKQILAVAGRSNLNQPFTTTANLVDVLKLLHNEIEFSSKVIESHGIACDEMIKNIVAFKTIIENNTYTQEDEDAGVNIQDKIKVNTDKRRELIDHYILLIDNIEKMKLNFLTEYKTDLVDQIKKIQTARPFREVVPKERKNLLEEIRTLEVRLTTLKQQQEGKQQALAEIDPVINELDKLKRKPVQEFKKLFTTIGSSLKNLFTGKKGKGSAKVAPEPTKAELTAVLSAKKAEKTQIKINLSSILESTKATIDDLLKLYGKEIATNHKKSEETLSKLRRNASIRMASMFGGPSSSSMNAGKNKKTKQNKQKHHKKYTKRNNKKIYGKRSQKHLKIKRHKYTKKHK